MFLARDKNGNLISALGDEVKKQTYYCPTCGARVRLRKGKNVRTHFAHESLKKCDFSMKMKDQNTWKTRSNCFIGLRRMMRLKWNIRYLN